MKKEKFYLLKNKYNNKERESSIVEVLGERLDDNLFTVRYDGVWLLVDIKTGFLIVSGSTRKNLLEKFISWGYKARYEELLENAKKDKKHYYHKMVANFEETLYKYLHN